ncbi:M56 family metallopeptidase [Flavobacterium sp. 1355]|uniref:M56 family metallopeptidase n=1 Tax=Flavobacterium sp. 1355 TaxID=2806571 RepID=UPI001AEB3350|nr:M56 family metallopeptidase [Flavobacterium sp. 1355]MBP1225766.1 beta-lactamase regulating signal transducer with metallopeptidase domain [Flavobacterium sp. 1355]
MINYLLKSGMLLLVFYAVYKLWLENEKMFRFNRAYLLLSLVFSFVIPLQLISVKPLLGNALSVIQLDGIVIRTSNAALAKDNSGQIITSVLSIIYLVVGLLLMVRFVMNLYSFYKKTKNNGRQFLNDTNVVLIEEPVLPHSFWKFVFINKEELETGKIPLELIAHERAHLQQKHTLDILFIEVLQIVFWFNPLIILFKKSIKLNHEFLADESVNKQFESVTEYQKLLLNFASHKNTVSLASNLNYLITKKRLIMMTKKESRFKMMFKVLIVSLVCVLSLFVFSAETNAQKVKDKSDYDKTISKCIDKSIEKQPEYPGGIDEFYKLIGMNFKIPAEASKQKLEGKAIIEFMVEKDGSLSEFKIVKDLGYGIGNEAIRAIKLSPKWIPGSIDGKPARVLYTMPITIQTEK